jgi:protein-tyrosine phosphatase
MVMKVLFVCLGNICRSPMAEVMLRDKVKHLQPDWTIDSAGLMGFLEGMAPDPRGQEVMSKRGMDISHLRSRKVQPEDLNQFDCIIAMDGGNFKDLIEMSTPENRHKIIQFTHIQTGETIHVPDPVLEEAIAFERTFHLLNECLHYWLQKQGISV